MNEIEQVPERFHGYSACSVAFNRSYRGVSKILAFVCHTNISFLAKIDREKEGERKNTRTDYP